MTTTGVKVYSIFSTCTPSSFWPLWRGCWYGGGRQPYPASFDLTRNIDAVYCHRPDGGMMLAHLLVHSFYVAAGGEGPEARPAGRRRAGRRLTGEGMGAGVSEVHQPAIFCGFTWALSLGFGIYRSPRPSTFMMIGAPLNAYFRSLEPGGEPWASIDLENRRAVRGRDGC